MSENSLQRQDVEACVHHMKMACISGDMEYLMVETEELKECLGHKSACVDDVMLIRGVSLQAAMDGKLKCLEYLHGAGIPLDVMCPIIAACHGHDDVIRFCERIGFDNCCEAWERYLDWRMCDTSRTEDDGDDEDLTLADEWVQSYAPQTAVECSCAEQTGEVTA